MMSYSHLNSEERRVIFHCFMYGISRAEIAQRFADSIVPQLQLVGHTRSAPATAWHDKWRCMMYPLPLLLRQFWVKMEYHLHFD